LGVKIALACWALAAGLRAVYASVFHFAPKTLMTDLVFSLFGIRDEVISPSPTAPDTSTGTPSPTWTL
jgi:hypothetical protein